MSYYLYLKKELIPQLSDKELDKMITYCEFFEKDSERENQRWKKMLKALRDEKEKRHREKVTFT